MLCCTIPLHPILYSLFVYRVVESKNGNYSVGNTVISNFGWISHTVSDGTRKLGDRKVPIMKLDPTVHTSPSTALGVLGMPG